MCASTPSIEADGTAAGTLHVAVAAIINAQRQVLLSLRPDHVHQGGLWEFPGGKLEPGETVLQALKREIHEELGMTVHDARPLIRIPHQYPDRRVLLDVWQVEEFSGAAHGREGQRIEWVDTAALAERRFPPANQPIIRALQLPDTYLITPEPGVATDIFLRQLESCLQRGVRLVQWRAPALAQAGYLAMAERIIELSHAYGAKVLLNGDPAWVERVAADGVHLNAGRLQACTRRPLGREALVFASCHDPVELRQAQTLGVDAACLSPVQATASHPGATALGWTRFAQWVDDCTIPVYALGGMTAGDTGLARQHGGQGIAAIRALWSSP